MLGGAGALRHRRRQRTYARFLAAALGLIDGSTACGPQLPRSVRIVLDAAMLRVCEADRAVGLALLAPDPGRLADAVAGLDVSRTVLVEAGHDTCFDAARRRSISLVG
jgi:hypothetical protein